MDQNFSAESNKLISYTREVALKMGNDFIGEAHFLLAMVDYTDLHAHEVLKSLVANLSLLKRDVQSLLPVSKDVSVIDTLPLTKGAEDIIKTSVKEAKRANSKSITTIHVLLAMFESSTVLKPIFEKWKLTSKVVYETIETRFLSSMQETDPAVDLLINESYSKRKAEEIWIQCLTIIKDIVEQSTFDKWFAPIQPVALDGVTLVVQVPNQSFYEHLEEHYINLLAKTVKRYLGERARLEYRIMVASSSSQAHKPNEEPNDNDIRVIKVEKASTFIINENIEGVLGIEEESKEIADLLVSLKPEPGMMVGLFGRWGRGKTFFWKKVWEKLDAKIEKPFVKVEFHAWKYQDTPASWAYLYERLSQEYTQSTKGNKVAKWFIYACRVLKLNVKRKGWVPILKLLFILLLGVSSWLLVNYFSRDQTVQFQKLVAFLGIPIALLATLYQLAVYLKKEYSSNAKDLFLKYSQKHSYKEQLGLQAEIQKEILTLLQVWIPEKSIGKKRILVFVDDIDRCHEEKIIQIIDSLRVMLDESEIARRVVVLAAVDERVLKMAISKKYYDLLSKDFESNSESKKLNAENLVREYMDKLFISGIKLKSLNSNERKEVLSALTKGKINLQDGHASFTEMDVLTTTLVQPSRPVVQTEVPSKDIVQFEMSEGEFELEDFEFSMLLKSLEMKVESTPRTIRIFYYRYLLAKRFMIHRFRQGTDLYREWNLNTDKSILPYLLLHYAHCAYPDNISNDFISELEQENSTLYIELLGKRFAVQKEVFSELLKIIDTVVPY